MSDKIELGINIILSLFIQKFIILWLEIKIKGLLKIFMKIIYNSLNNILGTFLWLVRCQIDLLIIH